MDDYAESLDDAEIFEKLIESLDDYFHLLVRKYGKTIFRVAWRMLGSIEDAEEVKNDTFEQAYRSLGKMIEKGQKIHFRPWLTAIVTNSCLNRKRHDQRKKRPPLGISLSTDEGSDLVEGMLDSQGLSAEDEAIQREDKDELYLLLRRLPPRQYIIIILYYIGGLSDPEIAGILGRKPNTIKKDRGRALEKLRKWGTEEE
jgi:RNA polymerase sigma-70 factor (ECF subfamily)